MMKGMGAALFFLLGTVVVQTVVADYVGRPGRCPDIKFNCYRLEPDKCKTDKECGVDEKCCQGCGLKCMKAVPEMTKCQKERQEAMKLNAPGRFVPDCDTNGNYEPLQCSRSSGSCWCVTSNGEKIPGTESRPGRPKPNCANHGMTKCQKERQEALKVNAPGKFVPDCDTNGNYEPLQCSSSSGSCWCVTSDGEKVSGTETRPGRPKPNCANHGEKEGTCPIVYNIVPCKPPIPRRCSSDRECDGKKKCCNVGCMFQCSNPSEIKPGTCPRPPAVAMVCTPEMLEKNRFCKNDMGCTGKQKCCQVGCQHVCKEPIG